MDQPVQQSTGRQSCAFLARLAALALMLTPVAPSLHAHSVGDDPAPPAYPDSVHILQGCFISTLAYLARFKAEFPGERAVSLTVELRQFHGQHTIAVVSWRGAWWGRDEYFGVFALHVAVARQPSLKELPRAAATALARHAESEVRHRRGRYALPPRETLPTPERAHQIFQAVALLPCASEFFWVADGREEIPMLFFRPTAGSIAVYEPLSGTANADCDSDNSALVVKTVATRLGYRVDHVRRDFNPTPGPPLAR